MSMRVEYDAPQHCTVTLEPQGLTVAMDGCLSSGGKGEKFSPGNMVGAGLAGCMLLSMGIVAGRDGIDLRGTQVDVATRMGQERLDAIDLTFRLPERISAPDVTKLERASGMCPIKGSFHPDTAVTARFETRVCCPAC